jgi:hypothetical protein
MPVSEQNLRIRPQGIRILSGVCFLLAAYLFASGVLVAGGAISLSSGRYLLGEYVNWGPVLYLVVGVALALLGIALDRGWRVARRTAIIGAAMLIATSLLPVSAAFTYFRLMPLILHGIKVVLAIMAIRYLLQPEVVEFFSAKGAPQSTE